MTVKPSKTASHALMLSRSHGSQMQLIFLVCLSLLIVSCKSSKKATVAPDQITPELKPWVLKYQRGPCFGDCPVYSFYLLSDYTGLVNVHANLLAPGWYAAPLDQENVDEIITLLEPYNWWHEDISDEPEIADLPMLSLTYYHAQGTRTLAVQNKISSSLVHVFEKINHLVEEGRWKPTELRPLETPEAVKTDVIVLLNLGVDVHEWMKKYDRFGIKLKKRVVPNQQYFVVSKDPLMGDANDFLQYIKLDRDVIDAQWDKSVQPRKN